MKKSHLLLIFTLSLLIFQTSCKKDDEPAPDPLVGKWKMDNFVLTFPAPYTQNNGEYEPNFYYGISSYTLDFKNDKTFSSDFRSGSIGKDTGTWTKSSNDVTLTYNKGDIFDDGDEEEYTLSTDNTQLSSEFTDTFVFTSSTDTVEVRANVKFVFEKQN